MRLLAIDTSATGLSAAIASREQGLIAEFGLDTGKNHSVGLLPMLDALLAQTGLKLAAMDAFAVTIGPGSFTGLRIGVATAKAWGDALDKPLVAVSSLDALARTIGGAGYVCPLLDARRNEVYTALYRDGQRLCPDRAVAPDLLARELAELQAPVALGGDGLPPYADIFAAALGAHYTPAAAERRLFMAPAAACIALDQLEQGETVSSGQLLPIYLRLSEAEEKRLQRERES